VLGLEDLEVGLLFGAAADAHKTLEHAKSFGVRAGQLAFAGDLPLEGLAKSWDAALTAEKFAVVSAVCAYEGENYADVPTVLNTVGLVPEKTRAERLARTKAVSDLARILGIERVACHIGFVPEDAEERLYSDVRDVTREICDYCAKNGQQFALETGQEPAKVLLRFIEDVKRPNLKINFDPANMILYGTGDPIEALDVLQEHVVTVHCKDGDWPDRDKPEALGVEKALGEGSVGMERYIQKLKEIGYRGVLTIEREEPDIQKRETDIRKAVKLLKKITKK
jgi:sugar phosphate isomerase/epimerase